MHLTNWVFNYISHKTFSMEETKAYLMSAQIEQGGFTSTALHYLWNLTGYVSHHFVVVLTSTGGVKVHELAINEENQALTTLQTYRDYKSFEAARAQKGKYSILKTTDKWNDRNARHMRDLIGDDKTAYNLFKNNCQYFAALIFEAGQSQGAKEVLALYNSFRKKHGFEEIKVDI